MREVTRQAQEQTLYDLFLVPILGVESLDEQTDTIPAQIPAQLLARILREDRDLDQPC